MKGKDTMRTAIWMLTAVLVLALAPLLHAAESGRNPNIIMQEALYQEQTEGDLDKAMELYEQVRKQAADVERLAARATYQLGMCHLKKGDTAKAIEYFEEVVGYYPLQTSLVERAQAQLDKLSLDLSYTTLFLPDADDVIQEGDVAVVLDLNTGTLLPGDEDRQHFNKINKGDIAYFDDEGKDILVCFRNAKITRKTENGEYTDTPDQSRSDNKTNIYVINNTPADLTITTDEGDEYELTVLSFDNIQAKIKYKKLTADTSDGLFEQATQAVWMTVSSMYGQVCTEAGKKDMYVNSNIHFVNSDFESWYGGYGFYYNTTNETISGRVQIGGTTYPNQTLYDIMGNPLETEIVPSGRQGHYDIYLNLPQDLPPDGFYPYAWAVDGSKKLQPVPFSDGNYIYKMENRFGQQALEVFFLVAPNDIEMTATSDELMIKPTSDYTIYAWTKEVQPDENHIVTVSLSKRNDILNYCPQSSVEAFLKAALSQPQNYTTAKSYILAGSGIIEELDAFPEILNGQTLNVESVYGNDLNALVITSPIHVDHGATETFGPLVFTLEYLRDAWFISDIDVETIESTKDEIEYFKKTHPDASLNVTQFEEAYRIPQNATEHAQLYLKALLRKDHDLAYKLCKPNSKEAGASVQLVNLFDFSGVTIEQVYQSARQAIAVTNIFTHPEDGDAQLGITMEPVSGGWQIRDFDYLPAGKSKEFIEEFKKAYPDATLVEDAANQPIDLSTPEATIESFVKAVYSGNLETAKKCVSKDGHDYDEFMEMLATESNHPFQAMIKAMDASIPVEITGKNIEDDRCKISWYFTLGRVYYFGETKMEKGAHQEFGSYLELVDNTWLIRDI